MEIERNMGERKRKSVSVTVLLESDESDSYSAAASVPQKIVKIVDDSECKSFSSFTPIKLDLGLDLDLDLDLGGDVYKSLSESKDISRSKSRSRSSSSASTPTSRSKPTDRKMMQIQTIDQDASSDNVHRSYIDHRCYVKLDQCEIRQSEIGIKQNSAESQPIKSMVNSAESKTVRKVTAGNPKSKPHLDLDLESNNNTIEKESRPTSGISGDGQDRCIFFKPSESEVEAVWHYNKHYTPHHKKLFITPPPEYLTTDSRGHVQFSKEVIKTVNNLCKDKGFCEIYVVKKTPFGNNEKELAYKAVKGGPSSQSLTFVPTRFDPLKKYFTATNPAQQLDLSASCPKSQHVTGCSSLSLSGAEADDDMRNTPVEVPQPQSEPFFDCGSRKDRSLEMLQIKKKRSRDYKHYNVDLYSKMTIERLLAICNKKCKSDEQTSVDRFPDITKQGSTLEHSALSAVDSHNSVLANSVKKVSKESTTHGNTSFAEKKESPVIIKPGAVVDTDDCFLILDAQEATTASASKRKKFINANTANPDITKYASDAHGCTLTPEIISIFLGSSEETAISKATSVVSQESLTKDTESTVNEEMTNDKDEQLGHSAMNKLADTFIPSSTSTCFPPVSNVASCITSCVSSTADNTPVPDVASAVSCIASCVSSTADNTPVPDVASAVSCIASCVSSTADNTPVPDVASAVSCIVSSVPSTADSTPVPDVASAVSCIASCVSSTADNTPVPDVASAVSCIASSVPSTADSTPVPDVASAVSYIASSVPSTADSTPVSDVASAVSYMASSVPSTADSTPVPDVACSASTDNPLNENNSSILTPKCVYPTCENVEGQMHSLPVLPDISQEQIVSVSESSICESAMTSSTHVIVIPALSVVSEKHQKANNMEVEGPHISTPIQSSKYTHKLAALQTSPETQSVGATENYSRPTALEDSTFLTEQASWSTLDLQEDTLEVGAIPIDLQNIPLHQWQHSHVASWFTTNGLAQFLPEFTETDGPIMAEMVCCFRNSPDVIMRYLQSMGFGFQENLKFCARLRTLMQGCNAENVCVKIENIYHSV